MSHKLPLLLWQFAENTLCKSLLCVKSWTGEGWHFPDFNGPCWGQHPVWFVLCFTYSFSRSSNWYFLSIYCVPGSVPTWSLCLTASAVERCSGIIVASTGGEDDNKEPLSRRQLPEREASEASMTLHWTAQQKPSPVIPPLNTPHTTRSVQPEFLPRARSLSTVDRLSKEPSSGSFWFPTLSHLVYPV